MSAATLQLDELPPLRVPLPFFLTAPVFGVLLGLLLLREGDLGLTVRWTPTALAATHLFTLGFLLMVMIGALFQVVPVLGGRALPGTRWLAPTVHPLLTAGALCLAHGLYHSSRPWLVAAMALLGLAFALLLPALLVRLLARRRSSGPALHPIRFAGLCLVATVVLGLVLAGSVAWPRLGLAHGRCTDLHALLGLGGWVLLLIAGVGSQVVPMFHVTPPFPAWLQRGLGPTVCAGLVSLAVGGRIATALGGAAVGIAAAGFAVAVLGLLRRRRRRRREPLVLAWAVAMVTLLACAALGIWRACVPNAQLPGIAAHQHGLLLAVLFGYGVAATVVLGMLGKILSFLAFTHLQRRCLRAPAAIPLLPPMNEIVSDRAAAVQLAIHVLAGGALVAAVLAPDLGRIAGAFVCADFAVCLHNVARGARR